MHSDLVFGDPWGLKKFDKIKGDSIVIVRTNIGQKILDDMEKLKIIKINTVDYQEVLKGQGIEKRKEKILDTIEIYKKMGFTIPKYFSNVNATKRHNYKLEEKINNFLKMEERTEKQNLKIITKNLRIKILMTKLKSILQSIKYEKKYNN